MSASLMPPWADPFFAREQVMAEMARWVRRRRARGVPCLMYVHGMEGLGVSCLCTQFFREHRDLVDGPLIWLNGRHPDGTPIPEGELLARTLRQLGVPESDQSPTLGDKVDALRRVSEHKTFMLVLDDLHNPGQIKPLVPDTPLGAVVVATSSVRRRTLETYGFEPFSPEFLPLDVTYALLRGELRETADGVDAAILRELADLCCGLPLLVKVLAAQIRGRAPHARRMLTRLRLSKLALLEVDDERRIPRFLDAAYESLGEEDAAAYRRLAVLPATTIGVEPAAAALDIDVDTAYALLENLVEFNLLVAIAPERYTFHPLLRDDARARAAAAEPAAAREGVLRRWTTWCLNAALPVGRMLSDRWWVAPVTEMLRDNPPLDGYTREQAVAWFDDEIANLVAAVGSAHRAGQHRIAWALCVVIWKYLHLHGRYEAWIDSHRLGLAAAEADDQPLAVMQLESQLGAAYLAIGEHAAAEGCFTRSLDLARAHSHALGEQSALEWLGKIAGALGHHQDALALYARSRGVAEHGPGISADQRARAFAVLALQDARTRSDLGDYGRAADDAVAAIAYFDTFDTETDNRAKARQALARALLGLHRATDAIPVLDAALRLFTADNARQHQAHTHRLLGDAHLALDDTGRAIEHYRVAHDYYTSVGNPLALSLAATLDSLVD